MTSSFGNNRAQPREHADEVLTGVGIVIGRVADGLNAALYLAEGNYLQAGLCAITFVPFHSLFGSAAEGARVAENMGEEANLAARLGEDAGASAARNAESDAAEMENLMGRQESEAASGESNIQPNEETEPEALSNTEDCPNPELGECFASGTEVETASGGEEPIQVVKVGDQVESRDQFNPNAPAQAETVTAVFQHTVTDLRDVTILGADGSTETIRATDGHPLYVQNIGWVDAQALVAGERDEEPDGSWATVSGNDDEPHPEGITVYNFEVGVNHTYFVSQGGAWVWVHNAPCPFNPVQRVAGQHHLIPRRFGSPIPYGSKALTKYSAIQHTRLQTALDRAIFNKWGYTPNTAGSLIRSEVSVAARETFLRNFYTKFSGQQYLAKFEAELAEVKRLGGLTP